MSVVIQSRKSFKNVSYEAITFLKNLSFKGYILAGHSVVQIMRDEKIRDLDFFVYENFINVFENEFMFENATFDYFKGFIEIKTENLLINLIYYEKDIQTPYEIIDNFDFPYVRAFIASNNLNIQTYNETLKCIATKLIDNCNKSSLERFHKAKSYGYDFSENVISEYGYYFVKYMKKNMLKKNKKYERIPTLTTNYASVIVIMLKNMPLEIIRDYRNTKTNFEQLMTKKCSIKKCVKESSDEEEYEEEEYDDSDYEEEKIIIRKGIKKISDDDESESEEEEPEPPKKTTFKKIVPKKSKIPEQDFDDSYEIVKNTSPNISSVISLDDVNKITIEYLPNELCEHIERHFETMFSLHPEEKHEILYGHQKTNIQVHRYQRNYGLTPPLFKDNAKSYMYSNSATDTNTDLEIPEIFKPLINFINSKNEFNQYVINWYENDGFIAEHSDCFMGMIENFKITTLHLIASNTLNDIFHLDIKKPNGEYLNIPLRQGQYTTMSGPTFQELYKHGVKKGGFRRINISFRQFIQ